MKYEDYKKFVINYQPFDWEINPYDFRETFKGKHSFIRFYKIFIELFRLKKKDHNIYARMA